MTFANHLGTKIFYQVVGNGLPLVMIPGALASYKDFFDCGYVSALKNKYKLILIDMRGFGKSSKPHQGNEYSFKLMVEDIIAVLDDLEIDRCHIYGHSLGGWLVWGLAIFYPERLQSIIIADGAPGSDDPTGFRYVAENLDEWVAKSETPQPFKDRLLANDRQALSAIVDWQFKEISSIIELINTGINRIDLPTLILMSNFGENTEEYVLLKKAESVIPDAILIQFEDLDHSNLFGKSDRVLPHIKEFYESN